jgi:hypothetical protein
MDRKQLQQLQKQAMQMQQQMEQIQAELGHETVEGTAGGGAVTVTMNGHRDVMGLVLSPEVIDPEDVEMLQDLILAAISDAATKAQALAEERMGPLMGGMGGMMPGM